MKVVINSRVGGFRLSTRALGEYYKRKGIKFTSQLSKHPSEPPLFISYDDNKYLLESDISRSDPILIKVVEELGEKAASEFTTLKIVDIPDGVEYIVCAADDGTEWVAEKHRTWE